MQDLLPQSYQYSKDEFAAYQKRTRADAARMAEMESLNSEHGPTVMFDPEEHVIMYAPPGQEGQQNDESSGWKTSIDCFGNAQRYSYQKLSLSKTIFC